MPAYSVWPIITVVLCSLKHLLRPRAVACGVGFQLLAGDLEGFAHTYDAGDVECARAQPALVAAAVDYWGQLGSWAAALHADPADAFGVVSLVAEKESRSMFSLRFTLHIIEFGQRLSGG
jgi:hypothetical protein